MERLQDLLCWIRARQEAWRVPLLLLALAAFVIGIVVSVRHLALSPDDLRLEPLLLLALIFVPLSIAYSALNMMLMGRAALYDQNRAPSRRAASRFGSRREGAHRIALGGSPAPPPWRTSQRAAVCSAVTAAEATMQTGETRWLA